MIFWEFHSGPYLWNAFILLLSCDASLSFLSSTLVTAIAASELWNDTTVLAQIFTDRCRFSSLLSYLFGIRQQHVWFWSNALLKYKGVLFYQHVCIKSCFKLGKNVSFLNGFSTQNWHDLCRSCQMFKKSTNSKTDKKKNVRELIFQRRGIIIHEVANMLRISFGSRQIILTDNMNMSYFQETCAPCTEWKAEDVLKDPENPPKTITGNEMWI